MPEKRLTSARRVVVKLGSNVITAENDLNFDVIDSISGQICELMDKGLEVILVSSGAIAAGIRKMKLDKRPDSIPERQAIAAIGQSDLINAYEKSFAAYGKKVAQILLTGEDLNSRTRYLNARNTINTLMEWKVIPIINENDTVMIEEIKLGDNDNLAAMIALLMDADFLFLLTDIDGLFDKDPRRFPDAKLIKRVERFDKQIEEYASDIPGTLGTGGMLSKIQAAMKVTAAGIPMTIARGDKGPILSEIFSGNFSGTYFVPNEEKLSNRKCWIAYTLVPKGTLILDDGAVKAVVSNGKSILAIGITRVEGRFRQGDAVLFKSRDGKELGTGLVNFNSEDLNLIKGLHSSQISSCLGTHDYDSVVHRDNLVLKLT